VAKPDDEGVSDEEIKQSLEFILGEAKAYAKRMVERIQLIKQSVPASVDARIHREVLEKDLNPELNRLASLIYSVILTFNKKPELYTVLKQGDILQAQLALDEITSMVREACGDGSRVLVNFNYRRAKDLDQDPIE
jgi:hypothetical protein